MKFIEENINGFVFNQIGQLLKEPKNASLELLQKTWNDLIVKKEYIKASRIQHRINLIEEKLL